MPFEVYGDPRTGYSFTYVKSEHKFFSERQRRWWFWYLQSIGHYLPSDILKRFEITIFIGAQEVIRTYKDLLLDFEKLNTIISRMIGAYSPSRIIQDYYNLITYKEQPVYYGPGEGPPGSRKGVW